MIAGAMQPFGLTLDKFLSHAAKWHPDAQVITAREQGGIDRVTYAELHERSRRISAVLRNFGVKRGDTIATLAWNTQAHLEALYGIIGIGAICHTLNPRLTDAQSASMLEQSSARILVVSAQLWTSAQAILARVPEVHCALIVDGSAADITSDVGASQIRALEPMLAETPAENVTWGDFDETSASGLCFTSGTTGPPKGVLYTHRSSYLHTMRILQVDSMAISRTDSVLAVVPMFHANAWGLPFAAPAMGAKLVLNGRHSDGATLERLINAEQVTIAVGIATVWLGLVEHLERSGGTVPTLKRIIVGGAPLPNALMERMEHQLAAIVQTSWGMTELSPSGTVAASNDPSRSAALSGRPAVGVDLLLTDAAGQALPQQREVEGHLRVRGASVVERYLGDAQSATDADGWFPTGDLARIDADGSLMITGRSKDLIKSGGEWINPAEIEAVVGATPEVLLSAVIGRADPKWGERPVLLVQLRDHQALSDQALLAPLKNQLPNWWIPDAVVRLERMPLTSTGKIDRLRLRADYGGE